MAYAGQILDNRITGERIVFRKTAADTGGELLAIDLVLAPDGHVPGAHVHPSQEERFAVVSGTMKFRLGGKKIIARAGDVVVVPAGSVHRSANAGEEPARVRVEVRPALKMEQLFETTVALARDGRTNRKGMPGRSTSRCSCASTKTRSARHSHPRPSSRRRRLRSPGSQSIAVSPSAT